MSNYICAICRAFQTKEGYDKVKQHLKEKHGIIVEDDKIEHCLVQC